MSCRLVLSGYREPCNKAEWTESPRPTTCARTPRVETVALPTSMMRSFVLALALGLASAQQQEALRGSASRKLLFGQFKTDAPTLEPTSEPTPAPTENPTVREGRTRHLNRHAHIPTNAYTQPTCSPPPAPPPSFLPLHVPPSLFSPSLSCLHLC